MEMKLKKDLTKKLRTQRAWSQSHLAHITGLSLRTIQRIEKNHIASLESVQALAAVFEEDAISLQGPGMTASAKVKKTATFSLLGLATSLLLGLTVLPATARPVMVNPDITSNGYLLTQAQLLNDVDKENELVIPGVMKIVLNSTIDEKNRVTMITKFFDLSEQGVEKLMVSPTLTTSHDNPAEVSFGKFTVSLAPRL